MFIQVEDRMWQFNQSLAYDKRMYAEDIRGSIAYAKALEKREIFTPDECIAVVKGLEAVGKEWEDGTVRRPFLLGHICFNARINCLHTVQSPA